MNLSENFTNEKIKKLEDKILRLEQQNDDHVKTQFII